MYASREGYGIRTPSTAYPNQGVDIKTLADWYAPYPNSGLGWAYLQHYRSLNAKYAGSRTPLGTPVADVIRSDALGIIASKCGYCGGFYAHGSCACHHGDSEETS